MKRWIWLWLLLPMLLLVAEGLVSGKVFKNKKIIRPSETGKVTLLPSDKARQEKRLMAWVESWNPEQGELVLKENSSWKIREEPSRKKVHFVSKINPL
jgi:hypothetical protein